MTTEADTQRAAEIIASHGVPPVEVSEWRGEQNYVGYLKATICKMIVEGIAVGRAEAEREPTPQDLRELMAKYGWTVPRLALARGAMEMAINDIFRGVGVFSHAMAKCWAGCFNCDISEVMDAASETERRRKAGLYSDGG